MAYRKFSVSIVPRANGYEGPLAQRTMRPYLEDTYRSWVETLEVLLGGFVTDGQKES